METEPCSESRPIDVCSLSLQVQGRPLRFIIRPVVIGGEDSVDASSSRWHRVTPSTFPWEDEAIDFLRSGLTDADPTGQVLTFL